MNNADKYKHIVAYCLKNSLSANSNPIVPINTHKIFKDQNPSCHFNRIWLQILSKTPIKCNTNNTKFALYIIAALRQLVKSFTLDLLVHEFNQVGVLLNHFWLVFIKINCKIIEIINNIKWQNL